jgi:hypothetical protein
MIGLPHGNNSPRAAAWRPNYDHDPSLQSARGNEALLAVIATLVRTRQMQTIKHFSGLPKIESPRRQSFLSLSRIEGDPLLIIVVMFIGMRNHTDLGHFCERSACPAKICFYITGGSGSFPASSNCSRETFCSCDCSRQNARYFCACAAFHLMGSTDLNNRLRYSYTLRRSVADTHSGDPSGQTRLAMATPIISVITVSPFSNALATPLQASRMSSSRSRSPLQVWDTGAYAGIPIAATFSVPKPF